MPWACRSSTSRRRIPRSDGFVSTDRDSKSTVRLRRLCRHAAPHESAAQRGRAATFPFAIELGEIYEGPLDLLLDLIRKQDIDIYDIPIAKITAQYLTYVERIRELDVNVASRIHLHGGGADSHQVEDAAAARSARARRTPRTIRATNWSTACSSTRNSSRPRRCSCRSSRSKTRS